MSMGPDKVVGMFDLFQKNGTAGYGTASATGAYDAIMLPPGTKVVQVVLPTSATATIKVQNSMDGTTWFDISSSTVSTIGGAGGGFLSEVVSSVPKWRVNISAFTVNGTGTANTFVAMIGASLLGPLG